MWIKVVVVIVIIVHGVDEVCRKVWMFPLEVIAQVDFLGEAGGAVGTEELFGVGVRMVTDVFEQVGLFFELLATCGTVMGHFRGLVRGQMGVEASPGINQKWTISF